MTSRRPEFARHGFGIAVEQLNQVDALELLTKSAKMTDVRNERGKLSYFSRRTC